MGTIIGIIILIGIALWVINWILGYNEQSKIDYLLRLCTQQYQEGQTRESMYSELLELSQEKKYSEYVINEVIVTLLYALVLGLINQGWTNPSIREALKAKGYGEYYIGRAIEKARANN